MVERREINKIILLVILTLLIVGSLAFRFFAGEEKLNENWADKLSYSGLFPVKERGSMQGLTVDFINVGQGDSALIICNGKAMLVDTGEKEYYTLVEHQLKKRGVEKLDFVVASHPHSDHIGAMSKIIENYEIGTLLMPEIDEKSLDDTEVYQGFKWALKNNSVQVEYVRAGDEYTLSDAKIEILSPGKNFEEINDMSVVFMLTYGENKFLFTGDIEEEAENAILQSGADLKCDVLKIAHNGSDTSTSEEFLERAAPEIAVISVGKNNEYGHPKRKFIRRLLRSDILIYRTDYDGMVSFLVPSVKSEIIKD